MALDLLAENDFNKLLNLVVADGQTLHIVFLLTYGSESARVLFDLTNRDYEMGVEESTALNEEEIICWLTSSEYIIHPHSGDGSSCRSSVARRRGT